MTNLNFLQNIEKTVSQLQNGRYRNTPKKLMIETIAPDVEVKQVYVNTNRIKILYPELSPNNHNKIGYSLHEREQMRHHPILIEQDCNELEERQMRKPYKFNRQNIQIKISTPTAINIRKQPSKQKSPIILHNSKHRVVYTSSLLPKEVDHKPVIESPV